MFSVPLECAKGLHLYDGRCFARCPDGTYASEITMERSSRRRNLTYFSESIVMKRQESKPASEALDMEPNGTVAKLHCLLCHYTCATCVGPHYNQCRSCFEDALLINSSDKELKSYCHLHDDNWNYRVDVTVTVLLFTVTSVTLYCIISFVLKKICCSNHYAGNIASNVAYNKLVDDEKHQDALEVEEEICKALKDYSESESDDDLNL